MRKLERLTSEIHRHVAASIRQRREQLGLSMLAVAERAEISQQMVSYTERGIRNPSLDTLLRITTVLEMDLGRMISESAIKARQLSGSR